MAEELETAQRFRLRAEEVRTIAEEARDKVVKDSLLKVAEDYERMAESLTAIDESNAITRGTFRPQR